ncbi:hypothetical protein GSQ41_13990, partial [Clostridioides difficile]|nr:hypothetical protein [Clostridioides difficile]
GMSRTKKNATTSGTNDTVSKSRTFRSQIMTSDAPIVSIAAFISGLLAK